MLSCAMQMLQSNWLRTIAEKQFYSETERFATADSVNIARLHTFLPGKQTSSQPPRYL